MESEKEAKIVQFKTKEQKTTEIRFRHLADHLDANPCFGCIDINSDYCLKECKSNSSNSTTKTTDKKDEIIDKLWKFIDGLYITNNTDWKVRERLRIEINNLKK